uniref:Potassium channel domain-containing protein n=1 Tax=Lotharella globosa TaxID=91324 RepID=A0A7S3YRS4_9EUKA
MSGADLSSTEQWNEIGWQLIVGGFLYFVFFTAAVIVDFSKAMKAFEERTSFTIRFNKSLWWLRTDVSHIFLALLNTLFCAFFIVRTYEREFTVGMRVVEGIGSIVFLIIAILEFVGSYFRLSYVLEYHTILNLIAIASAYYTLSTDFYLGFGFLRSVLALKHTKDIALLDKVAGGCGKLLLSVALLLLTVVVYVFLFASAIFITENLGDPEGIHYNPEEWSIYNSFYFMIVTMSTVGYGDFFATTLLGRLLMMFCIAIGIVIFAAKTGELFEIVRSDQLGHGRFRNPDYSSFVVVVGNVTGEILELILDQLLHPDRLLRVNSRGTRIVALLPTEKKFLELKSHFSNEVKLKNAKYLHFFVGNPLEPGNLDRVQIKNSSAVYILSPEAKHGAEINDLRQMFTAVAIRRHLKEIEATNRNSRKIPIKLNVSQRRFWQEYQHPLLTDPNAEVDVVSYDKMMMSLLASSALAPGFTTFLLNLITQIGEEDLQARPEDKPWMRSYLNGAANEMYIIKPHAQLYQQEFWDLHNTFMSRGALLLGYVRKNGWVYLAPESDSGMIPPESRLICMCQTLSDVERFVAAEGGPETIDVGTPLCISLRDKGLLANYDRVKILMRQPSQPSAQQKFFKTFHLQDEKGVVMHDGEIYDSGFFEMPASLVLKFCAVAIDLDSLKEKSDIIFDLYGYKKLESEEEGTKLISTIKVSPKEFRASLKPQEDTNKSGLVDSKGALADLKTFHTFTDDEGKTAVMELQPTLAKSDMKSLRRQRHIPTSERKTSVSTLKDLGSEGETENPLLTQKLEAKVRQEELSEGMIEDNISGWATHILDGESVRISDMKDLERHVVVFDCKPESLKYLLQPINKRLSATRQYQRLKIIIIHHSRLSEVYPRISDAISVSEDVYWVCTKSRTNKLFHDLRMHKARQVILCESHHLDKEIANDDVILPPDAPIIFLFVRLRAYLEEMRTKRGHGYVPVTVELQNDAPISFLRYCEDDRLFTHPLLAEGAIVTKKFGQLLLMQSQDNRFMVNVINALTLTSSREGSGLAQVYGIRLAAMKDKLKGSMWCHVREYFIPRKVLPIALYVQRTNDEDQKIQRLCISHPANNTPIDMDVDMVMVLSSKVPQAAKGIGGDIKKLTSPKAELDTGLDDDKKSSDAKAPATNEEKQV